MAFYGSSTYSLWDEDDILQRRAYDAWFDADITRLKPMLDEGMLGLYEAYNGGGETHSYFEQFNLFGDPSLDPWTAIPASFDVDHDDALSLDDGEALVMVLDDAGEPVADAWVSLYASDDSRARGLTDSNGEVLLDLHGFGSEEVAQLHISKHNFVPYWIDLSLTGEPLPEDTSDPEPEDTASTDTGPDDSEEPGPSDSGSPDTGDGFDGVKASPGCGCASQGPRRSWSFGLLALGLLLPWRRRRCSNAS